MPDYDNEELEIFRLFEMTPDWVCIASKDGFFKKINQAVIDKMGYTREELFSRPIASFIHADDRENTRRTRAELLEGKTLINFENRYITGKEEIIWLHWTSVYIPEKEIVFAIAKDVTERKQKEADTEEKYKKFESLANHFKTRLEKDKKLLANELHEELAQLASAVRMNVTWLQEHIATPDAAAQHKVRHSLSMLDLLIDAIRRLSFSISPNTLHDVGLNETLQWLCGEFSRINGIPCYFESSYNDNRLPHEIQLDIFRICQESLSNAMYHAEAQSIKVAIAALEDRVCLTVMDDGKGFRIEEVTGSSGLENMRKRAASINGQLTIQSEIGKGTRICATIAHPSVHNN